MDRRCQPMYKDKKSAFFQANTSAFLDAIGDVVKGTLTMPASKNARPLG
jgi:hypothetical protein